MSSLWNSHLFPGAWSSPPFLLMTIIGVAWASTVRFLLQHSMKHHKTHYKLSESSWLPGRSSGSPSANGVVQGGAGLGRERLKLEVQGPLAMKGGAGSALTWRQTLRTPSGMCDTLYSLHRDNVFDSTICCSVDTGPCSVDTVPCSVSVVVCSIYSALFYFKIEVP